MNAKRIIISVMVCIVITLLGALLYTYSQALFDIIIHLCGGIFIGLQGRKLVNWLCEEKEN